MKILPWMLVLFLLTPGLVEGLNIINPVTGPGPSQPESGTFAVSIMPAAVVAGDTLIVRVRSCHYDNGTAFAAFYKEESGHLRLLCKETVKLEKGSFAISSALPASNPGRVYFVVAIDDFGMGDFLPDVLPSASILSLAGHRYSDVRAFHVQPQSFAEITQTYEHILGATNGTYTIRLWTVRPDRFRDAAWLNLEPSRLLGSLYVPCEGYVNIYRGDTSYGHHTNTVWAALNGSEYTCRVFGTQETGQYTLFVTTGSVGYEYSVPRSPWQSCVTTEHFSETVLAMDISGVAPSGSASVSVSKRVLSLSLAGFDADMKELGSFRGVVDKRAANLTPVQGRIHIAPFILCGGNALCTGTTAYDFNGSAKLAVPLPFPGDYAVAGFFDQPGWYPGWVFNWEYYSRSLPLWKLVSVPGGAFSIAPESDFYAPGEPVVLHSTHTGTATSMKVYVDGNSAGYFIPGQEIALPALPAGRHRIIAVLELPGIGDVVDDFGLNSLTGCVWAASANVTVGSLRTSVLAQTEAIVGIASSVRVFVHDLSRAPVYGAQVGFRMAAREGGGMSLLELGTKTTDGMGSCAVEFTPSATMAAAISCTIITTVTSGTIVQETASPLSVRAQRHQAFISTDKPMYKAGDTIKAQLMVWCPDNLAPANGEIVAAFKNPAGRILHQEKLTLGPMGTVGYELPVGSECLWGTHWITVSMNDRTLVRKAVILKPYTLPMTKMTLSAGGDLLVTGGDCELSAYVEYSLFKVPVNGGTVQYNVTAYASSPLYDYWQTDETAGAGQPAVGASSQGQGQGQGQGQAQGSGNPEEEEKLPISLNETEYLDTLCELFSWDVTTPVSDGESSMRFRVPPTVSAFRVRAVFEDELEHYNEGAIVIYVNEKPNLDFKRTGVSTSKTSYSSTEDIDIQFRTTVPSSELSVTVWAAGNDGLKTTVLQRKIVTDRYGCLNTTLCGLGMDAAGLIGRSLHSIIVMAGSPDGTVRSFAPFTIYRYTYSVSTEKSEYDAGTDIHFQLSVRDELDLLGMSGTIHDENYVLRVLAATGTLFESTGSTQDGLASVVWHIPPEMQNSRCTVSVAFEGATPAYSFEVFGAGAVRMDGRVRAVFASHIEIEASFKSAWSGIVHVDAWSAGMICSGHIDVNGLSGTLTLNRSDPGKPFTIILSAFGSDGLKIKTLTVAPDRPVPVITVKTDRTQYEPGTLVNITVTSSTPALVWMAIVSNALYDGIPVLEKDWFASPVEPYYGKLEMISSWVPEQCGQFAACSSACAHLPSRATCAWPYYPGQQQGSGQNNGGSGGQGNGQGQQQGQGQGQQGGAQSDPDSHTSEYIPNDMDLSDEMRNDLDGVKLRRYFTDAAYWNPSIIAGPGPTVLSVKLPDNVRTWRIVTVGETSWCTGNVSTVKFDVKKPFYVEMRIPSTLTQDDEVILNAYVYNFNNFSVKIKLGFYAQGWLKVFGSNEQWLEMPANTVEMAPFRVKVVTPGVQNITLLATDFNTSRDCVFAVVSVNANGIKTSAGHSGEVNGSTGFDIMTGDYSVPEALISELNVKFGYEGLIVEGLESLTRYPYGCVEQTMSCVMPNILVWRYLDKTGKLSADIRQDLTSKIVAGIERLYGYHHPDGGWGWWNTDETNTFMTSWVLLGLGLIQESGFFVDPVVIHSAQEALMYRQNPDGGWIGVHWLRGRNAAMTAFATNALVASGAKGPAISQAACCLHTLWTMGTITDAYDVAWYSIALSAAGYDAYSPNQWLIDRMKDSHWEGRSLAGAIEVTGWATLALLRAGELAAAEVPLRWLIQNRNGAYRTTSSTMSTLLALDTAADLATGPQDTGTTVSLLVNGNEIARWNRESASTLVDLVPYISRAPAHVMLIKTGAGKAYYRYQQTEYIRPPVTVSFTDRVDTVAGKIFVIKANCRLSYSAQAQVTVASLGGSLPDQSGVQVIAKTVNEADGTITFRCAATVPGRYLVAPLIISYQLRGNDGLSSLIREYFGPINVTVGKSHIVPSADVTVEKTVSETVLRTGDSVEITINVISKGDAIGHSAELRDFIPGQFVKLTPGDGIVSQGVGEPGPGMALNFPDEMRWSFTLNGVNTVKYTLGLRDIFNGDMGRPVVLLDGYISSVAAAPAVVSTVTSSMFISRQYDRTSAATGEPVTVTISYGSESETLYYVALEDTVPPGFEVDESSITSVLDSNIQSYQIKRDKVTFFLNTLDSSTERCRIRYSIIPTMVGSLVAPPAVLFLMYAPATCAQSASAEVCVFAQKPDAPSDPGKLDEPVTEQPPVTRPPVGPPVPPEGRPSVSAPLEEAVPDAPVLVAPDYFVAGVRTVGNIRAGNDVVFLFTVGMARFEETTSLRVHAVIDGTIVLDDTVTLSRGYSAFDFSFNWKVAPGTHTIRIYVDPYDIAREHDEGNNQWVGDYAISSPTAQTGSTGTPVALRGALALVVVAAAAGLVRPVRRLLAERKTGTGDASAVIPPAKEPVTAPERPTRVRKVRKQKSGMN